MATLRTTEGGIVETKFVQHLDSDHYLIQGLDAVGSTVWLRHHTLPSVLFGILYCDLDIANSWPPLDFLKRVCD